MDATALLADEVACVIEELLPELSQDKPFPGDAAVRGGAAFLLSIFTPINRFMVLVDFSFRAERLGISVRCVWRCPHSPSAGCDRADSFEGWRRESFS